MGAKQVQDLEGMEGPRDKRSDANRRGLKRAKDRREEEKSGWVLSSANIEEMLPKRFKPEASAVRSSHVELLASTDEPSRVKSGTKSGKSKQLGLRSDTAESE